MAGTVVVMGAGGALGRRVVTALASAGHAVRALPTDPVDVAASLEGADAVVQLGRPVRAVHALDGTGVVAPDERATQRLLDALGAAPWVGLVWLSSAMVYGAWPDNPIPLTETAPPRPNPGLRAAEDKADRDRQVVGWGDEHPEARVVVLRPTVVVGEHPRWLRRSPWRRTGVQPGDADAPSQFVHVDDLVTAIVGAVERPLQGAYNVAPDGWIPAEQLRALAGPVPRLRLPAPVAERLARAGWRLGLSGYPPSVLPYTRHPWVVADDRLRATGWEPYWTNEEAFVVADEGGFAARLTPRRRQLLSLGVAGAGVVALVLGAVALVVRRRRRRPS